MIRLVAITTASLAALLSIAAAPALAQATPAKPIPPPPVICSHYCSLYEKALADPTRSDGDRALDASRKPLELLNFSGIEAGDHVLDVMAGFGYYSHILARAVGSKGKVIAQNPPRFIESEEAKISWAKLDSQFPWLTPEITLPGDFNGPNEYFDVILLHMTYHDLYWDNAEFGFPRIEPRDVIAKYYAALKPGGKVIVVDHVGPKGDPRINADKLHRIDPHQVIDDFTSAGFVFESRSHFLANADDDHHRLVFDPDIRFKTDRFAFLFRKLWRPGM